VWRVQLLLSAYDQASSAGNIRMSAADAAVERNKKQ